MVFCESNSFLNNNLYCDNQICFVSDPSRLGTNNLKAIRLPETTSAAEKAATT